ncbi:hypothetical protein EDB80DRAFT_737782 [Ilyonectria destructans]|nr:hypothetical protein EDB80DRAFT_737782 [Ilyonectria destructans]
MRILPHSLLLSSLYLFRHSASADADATDETYVVCLHDVFRRITLNYDRQEGGHSGNENPKMDGSVSEIQLRAGYGKLLEISFYC